MDNKIVPHENWLPVKNFAIYEVSDQGRVRNTLTGRILKPRLGSSGYLSVVLTNGNKKELLIHRIEYDAFKGLIDGFDVNHKNRIKTDNRLDNLHLSPHDANVLHGFSLHHSPEEICCDDEFRQKLIKEDFVVIYNTMKENNFSIDRVAKLLRIDPKTVKNKIARAYEPSKR